MRDISDRTAAHVRNIPAGVGIDESQRPELLDAGAANLAAVNVRQNQRGELAKRRGFTALANGLIDATSPTSGYKLFADKQTTMRICDGTAQVYDTGSTTWKSLGRVPDCTSREIDIPSMGTASYPEDQEYCNGYVAVAWRVASQSAFATIVNGTTWSAVRSPEQVGASSVNLAHPLLGSYGTTFVLFVSDQLAGTVAAFYLDTATAATITVGWVSLGTIKSDAHSPTAAFVVQSLSDRVAFGYVNNSVGTDRITVTAVTTAGVIDTRTVNTSSVTPNNIDIAGSIADTLWVAWPSGANVRLIGINGSALATTLATVVNLFATSANGPIGIAPSSVAGKGRLIINNATTHPSTVAASFQTSGGAAAIDGAAVIVPESGAMGRPFQYGARYYVPAYGGDLGGVNVQKNCILCDFTDSVTSLRPVATSAPGLAVVGFASKGKSFTGIDPARRYFGLGITRSSVANASALIEYNFSDRARWSVTAFGNSTFLSGGLLSYSDGSQIAESGFLIRPPDLSLSVSGTGITGTYRYVAVYEALDADGNWCVSGLSNPSAPISPANQTVSVITGPLSISSRINAASSQSSNVRVAVYRTLTGGVAPYYRVGAIANDTSTTTLTFTDAVTDTTLAANAKLYSQPGVQGTAQDRRPPPGLSSIVAYNGMLVGASGSDVWFSGQNVSGEGAWFNPIFQVPVPGQGDITGLWVMDGTLFVAKRRDVYAIAGDAPSDNGTGGLGQPRRLAVDVGCIESRSIVVTALGAFFQSDRGIEILTRAQTVEWIGQPLQTTVASFPVCTAATVDPVSSCVLFEMASSEASGLVSGTGRTLVFDLNNRQWVSTDRRRSAAGVADCPAQSACMIYTGTAWRYAWLSTTGAVHVEDQTSYLDADGSFVTAQWETPWLKHGLQQEQLVWGATVLYQQYTASGLLMEIAYDYQPYSSADNKAWTEAQTLGAIQLEARPKPRSEALKVRISDSAPVTLGTGRGMSFIGLSFDLAPKQGATKGTQRLSPALRK